MTDVVQKAWWQKKTFWGIFVATAATVVHTILAAPQITPEVIVQVIQQIGAALGLFGGSEIVRSLAKK
jgi:fumarate reductase subunit C